MATTPSPIPWKHPGLAQELAVEEEILLETRRRAAADTPAKPIQGPRVGLALSGGGIRSATFSLGLLQSLARHGLLRRIDYLSTVSGGGYIGGFLGALFVRPPEGEGNAAQRVEATLADPRSRPLAWLRENGRYLTPGGSGDSLLAGAVVIRNWVALQVVLGTFALLVLLGMGLLRVYAQRQDWVGSDHFLLAQLVKGPIWWSPFVLMPLAVFMAWIVPAGWAYWLVASPVQRRLAPGTWIREVPPLATALATVGLCAWGLFHAGDLTPLLGGATKWVLWGVGGPGALAVLFYLVTLTWAAIRRSSPILLKEEPVLGPRRRLTDLLRVGFAVLLATGLMALVDSLGQSLYAYWAHEVHLPGPSMVQNTLRVLADNWKALVAFLTSLGAFSAAVMKALGVLRDLAGEAKEVGRFKRLLLRSKAPLNLVALATALLLVVTVFTAFSFLCHGITWGWQVPAGDPGAAIAQYLRPGESILPQPFLVDYDRQLTWLGWAFGLAALLSLAFGRTFEFLNQSSLGPFYAAMLTRAYVGASNPGRKGSNTAHVVEGDDLPLSGYAPHLTGGPLHLINATLNETCGGGSQVVQKDRHGLGMAVGPAGIQVGVRHFASWVVPGRDLRGQEGVAEGAFGVFRVRDAKARFDPEPLTLGRWMGISGAAASTGMGARTSLGTSLLMGFFNVRMGHWWRSGVDPAHRLHAAEGMVASLRTLPSRLFTVQVHLLDEFLARFHGTARMHWYLSDGGHFENTGCYELIRRRVPVILLCDDGADEGYLFGDLVNLIRKARVDFGAEIRLLDREGLKALFPKGPVPFCTLEELRAGMAAEGPGRAPASAAVAAVTYDGDDAPGSFIFLLKPSLTGTEPLDVAKYREAKPDFPQQTTADQFFDEAQWESYRKLGEHIGDQVLPCLAGDPRFLGA